MKKLTYLLVILIVILTSCKTIELTHIPKKEIFSGIDFREYSNKGFLFTPEKFDGKYESIGLVSFLIMPEANKIKQELNPKAKQWEESEVYFKWAVKSIDVQNAVEGIYKRCIEMGADALINFKAEINVEDYSTLTPPCKIEGYRISGFAIKRNVK